MILRQRVALLRRCLVQLHGSSDIAVVVLQHPAKCGLAPGVARFRGS